MVLTIEELLKFIEENDIPKHLQIWISIPGEDLSTPATGAGVINMNIQGEDESVIVLDIETDPLLEDEDLH